MACVRKFGFVMKLLLLPCLFWTLSASAAYDCRWVFAIDYLGADVELAQAFDALASAPCGAVMVGRRRADAFAGSRATLVEACLDLKDRGKD